MSQAAACAQCDKDDCSTVVILPAVPDSAKKFDFRTSRLEVDCPACHRAFTVPVNEIVYCDVTDEHLRIGFMPI